MPYDKDSDNAMFATIIQRLDQQDRASETYREEVRESLKAITTQVTETNGQVRDLRNWQAVARVDLAAASVDVAMLKTWREGIRGRVAGISLVVSGVVVIVGLILQAMLVK